MTTIECTPIYLGIFFLLSLLIIVIVLALVVLSFVFALVLIFHLLLFALLLLRLILVFFFDKLNLTVYFLLLFLSSCFCFIDDGGTKSTVFEVTRADIEVVLLVCQSTRSDNGLVIPCCPE